MQTAKLPGNQTEDTYDINQIISQEGSINFSLIYLREMQGNVHILIIAQFIFVKKKKIY